MNTATQLKALIRNLAKEKSIDAQILLRNYMLERLLERISLSEYRCNFILKGGMLVAAIVGIDARSTIDMDATIKDFPISKDAIEKMFETILMINLDDSVKMKIRTIEEIREEAEYAGLRITIETEFDKIKQMLKVDVTTGEDITPREVEYSFSLMLEDRKIDIMAYSLETVLAEKLETIISRGTANTRMRDFYDVYILTKLQSENVNTELLGKALKATSRKRGTFELFNNFENILDQIEISIEMQNLWKRYQIRFSYAIGIEWNQTMRSVKLTMGCLN